MEFEFGSWDFESGTKNNGMVLIIPARITSSRITGNGQF